MVRRLWAVAVVGAALGMVLASGSGPRPDAPAGGPDDAYAFVPAEEGGFVARNAEQQFEARFTDRGVRVQADDRSWGLGLELAAWGRPGSMVTASAATAATTATGLDRLDLRRGPITEWFQNDASGLEQSFDVAARPPGRGPIVLELAAAGLSPRLGGDRVVLVADQGEAVLGYGGLYAEDATGRSLPASLGVVGDRVTVTVDDRTATYPILIDPLLYSLEAELLWPSGAIGEAVDTDGDTAVVGASEEDAGSGAAYVYVRDGGGWSLEARMTAPLPEPFAGFGAAVAVDGDTAVVGAQRHDTGDGAAYVFVRAGSTWVLQSELVPSVTTPDDRYGVSVSVAGDTAVVAASGPGAESIFVFVRSGSTWTEQARLTAPGELTAQSVAVDGDTVVGAGQDRLALFTRVGTIWTQQPSLVVPGSVLLGAGSSRGVDIDGDTVVAGQYFHPQIGSFEGRVHVFVRVGGTWSQQATLTHADPGPIDQLGISVGIDGDRLIASATERGDSGAAIVFGRVGTTWTQEAELQPPPAPNPSRFGASVAIAGNIAMVGDAGDVASGTGPGSVRVFERSGPVWGLQEVLDTPPRPRAGDRLGTAVAIDDFALIAGAPGGTPQAPGARPGEIAFFGRFDGTWRAVTNTIPPEGPGSLVGSALAVSVAGNIVVVGSPGVDTVGVDAGAAVLTGQLQVFASDGAAGDRFGAAVATDGTTVVVGAPGDEGDRGAVYVFVDQGSGWMEAAKIVDVAGAPGDRFGSSVAVAGGTVLVGAPGDDGAGAAAGAAHVFTGAADSWSVQAELAAPGGASGDSFGHAVALHGDTAAVGAPGDDGVGSVRVFVRTGTAWAEQAALVPGSPSQAADFGWSVSTFGDDLLIGAPGEVSGRGAAYSFGRTGAAWFEHERLVAPDGAAGDGFGWSVSVSATSAGVGAPGTDHAGGATDGGAVYAFGVTQVPAVSIGDVVVGEGDGTAVLTLTLTEPAAGDVTIDFQTVDGTAQAPDDYTAITGAQAIIPALATTATVAVPIDDDADDEPDEALTVQLTSATGAVIDDGTGRAEITDDDDAPVVTTTTAPTTTTTRRFPGFPTTTTTRPRVTTTTTTTVPGSSPGVTTTTTTTPAGGGSGPPPTLGPASPDPFEDEEPTGVPPRRRPSTTATTRPGRPTTATTAVGSRPSDKPGDDAAGDDRGDSDGRDDDPSRDDDDDRGGVDEDDGDEQASGDLGAPGSGDGNGSSGSADDGPGPGGSGATGERAERTPDLVEAVVDPTQVSTDGGLIVENLFILTPVLILLVTFPGALFNSTMGAHYDEINRWFRRGRQREERRRRPRLNVAYILLIFTPLTAIVSCFVSPDFGWDRASAGLFLGMCAALLVVVVLFDMVRAAYMRRRHGATSHLRPRITGLVLGLVLVLISRVSDFQPGYIYGDFTALVFALPPPKERDEGRGLALASLLLGAASLAAWFALDPIRDRAAEPDAAFWLLVLSSACASLWVAGLGAIVFGLAPVKFFQGEQVMRWSRVGWLAIFGTSVFVFVHVLAHPESGFYGQSADTTLAEVMSLFLGFAAFSVAFWAYFRFRSAWRKSRGRPVVTRQAS